MTKWLFAALVGLALAGCAGNAHSWIGHSEDEVVNRFGPPEKSYRTEEKTYLEYNLAGVNYSPANEGRIIQPLQKRSGDSCRGIFTIEDEEVIAFRAEGTGCLPPMIVEK